MRGPLSLLILVVLSCGASKDSGGAGALDVGCAASLRATVEDLAGRFAKEHGVRVRISAASSSEIARQIRGGAPVDVFVSAHPKWIQSAVPGVEAVPIAGNRLVIAGAWGAERGTFQRGAPLPAELRAVRIAMGDPDHVPVGGYARDALLALGWWDALEGQVLTAPSASAAARLYAMGEVDAVIGYATDFPDGRAGELRPLAADLHPPIVIEAAAVSDHPLAAAFVRELSVARALVSSHGFTAAPTPVR